MDLVRHVAACALLAWTGAQALAAETPEATDPQVRHCAQAAWHQLKAAGFAGAAVDQVMTDRANASIDRWEEPFNAKLRIRVATLIRVPTTVTYRGASATLPTALEARCGFNSERLMALEIVKAAP